MKTIKTIIVLGMMILSLNSFSQNKPIISAIGIFSSGIAKDESKTDEGGFINLDVTQHESGSKSDLVDVFGSNIIKTDDGKNTADEITKYTQAQMQKALATDFVLGNLPKKNKFGITGGAINLDGLPSDDPKKVAKSKSNPAVYDVNAIIHVTYFKKSNDKFDIDMDGKMKSFPADKVYKVRLLLKVRKYDETGKIIETKFANVQGSVIPRYWIDEGNDSDDGISMSFTSKKFKIQPGEGLAGTYLLDLYQRALDKALGIE
jgi:hypothetical protein